MSDESILEELSQMYQLIREEAPANNFSQTNHIIDYLMVLSTTTTDPALVNFYKTLIDTLNHYKLKVIQAQHQLKLHAEKWTTGQISDESLFEVQILINGLYLDIVKQ
jgi:hypothetical protein